MNLLNIHNNLSGMTIKDRYQIEHLLGEGGFGAVYKGRDTALDVPVAVKMLFDNSPASITQFKSEAKILAKLKHPHLPRVTDYFSESTKHYLVMDYIEGKDLQEILNKSTGFLNNKDVMEWIIQILGALEYIHSNDIVHRDIKPGNIKVTPTGFATLVDFGIAKAGVRLVTSPGARGAFTPYMASPEQCTSTGKTTPASDIYSTGATLYYLLTGQFPMDAVSRLMGQDIVPPRKYNTAIPNDLSNVIFRSMAIDPHLRYRNAEMMREQIGKIVRHKIDKSTRKSGGFSSKHNTMKNFRREIRRK
ncbi:MAG: serine/threonine protein kinase [Candidatus Eremiobacteraeota bacterium]|nr:serine/threonine protein kinase [Candidatus Eremiobacteraeota bacterium]